MRSRPMRIIFARHGETTWNRVVRFRGLAEVPLTPRGRWQARRIAQRLAAEPLTAIYSSPLSRALRTAAPVAAVHRLPVVPHPALRDLDYGAWQGRRPADIARTAPRLYRTWLEHPSHVQIPGGERLSALRRRVRRFLDDVRARHAGRTVLLVSHDVVGRVLMGIALGLTIDASWGLSQDNAAIDVLETAGNGFVVRSMNDTGHLVVMPRG
jgi:alpha-ribazole phosphatase